MSSRGPRSSANAPSAAAIAGLRLLHQQLFIYAPSVPHLLSFVSSRIKVHENRKPVQKIITGQR